MEKEMEQEGGRERSRIKGMTQKWKKKHETNKGGGLYFLSPVVMLSVEGGNEVDRLAKVAL